MIEQKLSNLDLSYAELDYLKGVKLVVGSNINLIGSSFVRYVNLSRAQVGGEFHLDGISIGEEGIFTKIKVGKNFYLNGASIRYSDLSEIIVSGFLDLRCMKSNYIGLQNSELEGVKASSLRAKDCLTFKNAEINGNADISSSTLQNLGFEGAKISGDLNLNKNNLDFLDLRSLEVDEVINLEDTEITRCRCDDLVLGCYKINSNTKIPKNLKKVLENYPVVIN